MSFKVDDVQKLLITHDDGTQIEIDRDGDKWKIVKPGNYEADPTQVRQILTTLGDSKVADFITDAPTNAAQYGLEKPHLVATVYLEKGGAQESLLFGFKQKESGQGRHLRAARRARADLYDRAMGDERGRQDGAQSARQDRAVFRSVEGRHHRPSIRVTSRSSRSSAPTTINGTLSPPAKPRPRICAIVERFMDQIHDLKGNSIIMDPIKSPEMFGMDKPSLTVTLQDKDGKQVGQFRLSKIEVKKAPTAATSEAPPSASTQTDYYAASSASRALFSTDDFLFSQLNKTADEFRAKESATPAATPKK